MTTATKIKRLELVEQLLTPLKTIVADGRCAEIYPKRPSYRHCGRCAWCLAKDAVDAVRKAASK